MTQQPLTEEVRADMVAAVLQVDVRVGDAVTAGTTLILLESMKMEIPVVSETSGRVERVTVDPGDIVQEGDLLVVIGAPDAG